MVNSQFSRVAVPAHDVSRGPLGRKPSAGVGQTGALRKRTSAAGLRRLVDGFECGHRRRSEDERPERGGRSSNGSLGLGALGSFKPPINGDELLRSARIYLLMY